MDGCMGPITIQVKWLHEALLGQLTVGVTFMH